jgi:ABC-type lipoprotein release transport system permease subunit
MIDVNVYGLRRAEWAFLELKKSVAIEEGAFEAEPDSSIMVTRLIAETGNFKIGDWITLEVTTAYGVKNSLDFKISGICKNGVPWNNDYIYMAEEDARLLFDFDPEDFDSMRIYLKDTNTSGAFARELNAELTRESKVLQAVEGKEASSFFTQQSEFLKSIFTVFVIFLIIIIGFGIRATVRMNLFERMSEFGTLRAIGFNRIQIFFIIFCEIFLLALFSLLCAFSGSTVIVLIFSQAGVHIGSGPISYLFGGDYLYPIFKFEDVLFAVTIIFILSFMAPFKPAMKLCRQKICDILLKRQERSPLIVMAIKKIVSRRPRFS